MICHNTSLEAVEYVLPPFTVSSEQLENEIQSTMRRLGIPKGLLRTLTGIGERRVWPLGKKPSEVATAAAVKAIESSGVDPKDIGCIINTSVCRDYIEPSVSCIVHGNLKLSPSCMNFDITNACLGFLNAIDVISMMVETGRIKYGLIVNGETSGEVLANTLMRLKEPHATMDDYRNNFASLTLGSAAVAAVIGPGDLSKSGHIMNGLVNLADTRYSKLCVGQQNYMKADASLLMKRGVELAFRTWKLAEQELPNWSDEKIDCYIPHQVSQKNIDMLNSTLKITPEKQQLSFMKFGNIGPAAIPVTLKMTADQGKIQKGHNVAMLGIGSGLNCSMMSLNW